MPWPKKKPVNKKMEEMIKIVNKKDPLPLLDMINTGREDFRAQMLKEKKEQKKLQITKEYIIEQIHKEIKSKRCQRSSDRLKGWELLGKTQAIFTDKTEHTGLPKRIIIRTSGGVDELTPTND
jgi:hypothetical protein